MSLRRHFESSGAVLAVSLFCAFLCSFTIEGRVLVSVSSRGGFDCGKLVFAAMTAHVAGLLLCGFFVRDWRAARRVFAGACCLALLSSLPFCFRPAPFWFAVLPFQAFVCGFALASWGALLRAGVPRERRFKACAELLILTASFVSFIYVVMELSSPLTALWLALAFLAAAAAAGARLPAGREPETEQSAALARPTALLCLFILIFTINSGLMYQVVLPAFDRVSGFADWFWNVPYIAAIAVLSLAPMKNRRSWSLYAGIVMLMLSFLAFVVSGRGPGGFVAVNTLMLGAFGIFDLFWWSVITEMLDYARNPVKQFGVCMAANVGGVALGDGLGQLVTALGFRGSNIALLAMSVICVTLLLLPFLNARLLALFREQAFLPASRTEEPAVGARPPEPCAPLTRRESDVFRLLLDRKSNAEIAAELCLTENTIKTHVRNILAKYEAASRKELFSKLKGL